jgi:hypothetical protein
VHHNNCNTVLILIQYFTGTCTVVVRGELHVTYFLLGTNAICYRDCMIRITATTSGPKFWLYLFVSYRRTGVEVLELTLHDDTTYLVMRNGGMIRDRRGGGHR